MSEDRFYEQQRERIDSDAEEYERQERDRIDALMQKGAACYPFVGPNIQEAFAEMSHKDMCALQEAAEAFEWGEWMALSRAIVRDYWERQARASK